MGQYSPYQDRSGPHPAYIQRVLKDWLFPQAWVSMGVWVQHVLLSFNVGFSSSAWQGFFKKVVQVILDL